MIWLEPEAIDKVTDDRAHLPDRSEKIKFRDKLPKIIRRLKTEMQEVLGIERSHPDLQVPGNFQPKAHFA